MQEHFQLIEQLQRKDSRAFSKLYDAYSGALYGVIIRICKNENLAQEVLQETFMKMWDKAPQYNPEKGRFYTWAYRIARNSALNSLRNPSPLIQMEDVSVYSNKEDTIEEVWDFSQLNGSLKKLDEHHRKALELVYFQGLTHREAHSEMNVPLGTFKSYVQQALKKLRENYPSQMLLFWLTIEQIL